MIVTKPSTSTAMITRTGDSLARKPFIRMPGVSVVAAAPVAPGGASGAGAACAPRLRVDAMTDSLAILAAGEHARPLWRHRAVPGPDAYRRSACRGPAPVRPLLSRRRSTARAAQE